MALSINHGPKILHYLLLFSRGQWALIAGGQPSNFFPLIEDLVAFYRDNFHETVRLGKAVTQARAAVIRAARTAAAAEKKGGSPAGRDAGRAEPLFRCAQCEHEMETGAVFCSHCGAHNPDGGVEAVPSDDTDNATNGEDEPGDADKKGGKRRACPPSRKPTMATMEDVVRHFSVRNESRGAAPRWLSTPTLVAHRLASSFYSSRAPRRSVFSCCALPRPAPSWSATAAWPTACVSACLPLSSFF